MKIKKRIKHNCAIISFFPIFPTYSGASEVVYSLYKSWPGNRKLFYLNNFHKNSKLNSIAKLLKIPFLFLRVYFHLLHKPKKIVIIEGASWIGFSFFFLILSKIFLNNTKIIYHAHNIEYEIRKINSSKITILLTKYFENLTFKISDIPTVVSYRDKITIKKLYNKKSYIFQNGLDTKRLKVKKVSKPQNYILFVGSYLYYPNRIAIKKLIKINKNFICKKLKNFKVIIVGKGLPLEIKRTNSNLKHFEYLKKNELNKLMISSKFILAPLIKSPGTKIKIIETMMLGIPLIVSRKGMIGIKIFKNSKYPLIYKSEIDLINKIKYLNQNYKNYRKKIKEIKLKYRNFYSMKNVIKDFMYENKIF